MGNKSKKRFSRRIRATHGNNKIISLEEKLNRIYNKVDLRTTCCGQTTCCKTGCPQMNYCEFSALFNVVWKNANKSEKIEMICKSIEYFFHNDFEKHQMKTLVKPCVLLSKNGKCSFYLNRPLSCFVPETWVYTFGGPKRIKDILAGDKVYGKDGKLHKVISTYSRFYSGNIHDIRQQGNNIPSECSSDHRWLTIYHKDRRVEPQVVWTEAKDLVCKANKKIGHYLSLPIKFDNSQKTTPYLNVLEYIKGKQDGETITPYTGGGKLFEGYEMRSLPQKIEIDSDFLFMIGIYLAEGSSSSQSSTFTMNLKEKHCLDRIAKYLGKYNIPSHFNKVKKGKNVIVLRVDSCLFARLMSELCGKLAHQKAIDEKMFAQLSNEDKYKIYQAWDIGDGRKHLTENESSTITISEKLAVQMAQILVLNGIFPRIYVNKRSDRGYCNYDVHVFPSSMGQAVREGQGTKIMADKEYIYIPLDDIKIRSYNGPLIDIQVEDSESFITTAGIVHNCRMYGLWPEDIYKDRVDTFERAYEGLVKREDLPLNTQCPNVKRIDSTKPLTKDVIENLYSQLDDLDGKMTNKDGQVIFTKPQIENRENYRTFQDWLLLKVFGEEKLADLTDFSIVASASIIDDQVDCLKKVMRDSFSDEMFNLEL